MFAAVLLAPKITEGELNEAGRLAAHVGHALGWEWGVVILIGAFVLYAIFGKK